MRRCLSSLAVLGILLTTTVIWACSVPVFRYALERWPADKYTAVVFHRGGLTPQQQTLISHFDQEGAIVHKSANVELKLVDLDADPAPADLELWKAQKSETLPLLVVRTPLPAPVPAGFWSGELTEENITRLIDSPLRQNIAKQLVNGQTAVWVFLESGEAEKDKAARELLVKELKRMEKTLKLPEIEQADIEQGLVSVSPDSLKLKFSIVTCSRDDSAEQYLTQMLLATESDLKDFDSEPMALPVFGRGRVLYALIGKGINPGTIEQACRDLTGPCTCQVKDQNPGTDLLMSVPWEKLVTPTAQDEKELPPLTGLTSFSNSDAGKNDPGSMAQLLNKQAGSESSNTEKPTVKVESQSDPVAETVSTEPSEGTLLQTEEPGPVPVHYKIELFLLAGSVVLVIILAGSYMLLARKQ
ncbi:hypothetical protein [Gimesia algae]|uniref:Uncharacterized protein n=1 Tax=Gimesia algae TaxID=2527971 RepID=A0A517V8H3_9PLAN|nr:hypothetical protein [Gimesia algae]QDT89314.1 hypothetical protein Pan161_09430 [Gimesia algae]